MQAPKPPRLVCPRCSHDVCRIRRTMTDRFIGLFLPRWRFRCTDLRCGWQGLLRSPLQPVDGYQPDQLLDAARASQTRRP